MHDFRSRPVFFSRCLDSGATARALLPTDSRSLACQRSMGESAYSFSLTTFSPSGKLVQACRDLHSARLDALAAQARRCTEPTSLARCSSPAD